jgi:hypothetical protein
MLSTRPVERRKIMKKCLALVGLLVFVLTSGSDSPRAYDDAVTASDGLEGAWQYLGFELKPSG